VKERDEDSFFSPRGGRKERGINFGIRNQAKKLKERTLFPNSSGRKKKKGRKERHRLPRRFLVRKGSPYLREKGRGFNVLRCAQERMVGKKGKIC